MISRREKDMNFQRRAGILLHPTSLPGRYGMGEIGVEARSFIEILRRAGQTYWQLLPVGPTGYGDSPYQALSTFAGNPMLLCFEDLKEEGLLKEADFDGMQEFPSTRVDYGPVLEFRRRVLLKLCRNFKRRASVAVKTDFDAYCEKEAAWLDDFALFSAIKEDQDLRPWTDWPAGLAGREPVALERFRKANENAIRYAKILQFLFDRQWNRLHAYAKEQGVQLIGDIPIFVAQDSSDVWANRELFYLDDDGQPTVVAGVPPDYFSATGQLWGNPLYRWDVHEATGFSWWLKRLRHILSQVDVVRIDHFRGFEAYWEVPGADETAMNGRWVNAPGHALFETIRNELGDLPVIAEDLGVITDEVDELRDRFELPGMRILQFSFVDGLEPKDQPAGFPENCIVYTGTHDNDTTLGWFWREAGVNNTETAEQIEAERNNVRNAVRTDGSQIHWDLIAKAHGLHTHTAIVPLQDVMGLGTEARMNVPGVTAGNWAWRFTEEQLRDEDMQRLRDITAWANRLPS